MKQRSVDSPKTEKNLSTLANTRPKTMLSSEKPKVKIIESVTIKRNIRDQQSSAVII